jgi:hypothetical protein
MSAAKSAKKNAPSLAGKWGKNGRPTKAALASLQAKKPEAPPQNPQKPETGGVASSDDEFLNSTAGFPQTIEDAADPFAGRPPEPEVIPPAQVAIAIDRTAMERSLAIAFGVLGRFLAKLMRDDVMLLSDEEKRDLGEAWAPVTIHYLQLWLGAQLANLAGPAVVTTAIFGTKLTLADLNRAARSKANTPRPGSPESSASSANGQAEKPPYYGRDFG